MVEQYSSSIVIRGIMTQTLKILQVTSRFPGIVYRAQNYTVLYYS